jgi:hypothetical protein
MKSHSIGKGLRHVNHGHHIHFEHMLPVTGEQIGEGKADFSGTNHSGMDQM